MVRVADPLLVLVGWHLLVLGQVGRPHVLVLESCQRLVGYRQVADRLMLVGGWRVAHTLLVLVGDRVVCDHRLLPRVGWRWGEHRRVGHRWVVHPKLLHRRWCDHGLRHRLLLQISARWGCGSWWMNHGGLLCQETRGRCSRWL
jgi:hypothetical protein